MTAIAWMPERRTVIPRRRPAPVWRLLAGGLAGFLATLPMTVIMVRLHKLLPPREKHALPPRHITESLAEKGGLLDELNEDEMAALTLGAHFGYGAASGALFGLAAPALPGPPALSGIAYGLAVWAGSYLGWLPALGVLPSAAREAPGRNALMIAAHLVWGLATGILTGLLVKEHGGAVRHET